MKKKIFIFVGATLLLVACREVFLIYLFTQKQAEQWVSIAYLISVLGIILLSCWLISEKGFVKHSLLFGGAARLLYFLLTWFGVSNYIDSLFSVSHNGDVADAVCFLLENHLFYLAWLYATIGGSLLRFIVNALQSRKMRNTKQHEF